MSRKCQKCSERAVIHITDLDDVSGVKESHFCYKHAQEHLRDSDEVMAAAGGSTSVAKVAASPSAAKCPLCKITFEDFRTSGRLGCAHDYEVFRDELRPLLENIHGSLRHIGKVPRRLPADTRIQTQLMQMRQELQQAVAVEDYERAARLRDQIGELEEKN